MFSEPFSDNRVLMRPVVVADQVDLATPIFSTEHFQES